MSTINNVLKDESNNDKQLAKEIGIYVKNHKEKGLPINKRFVLDVASIALRNSEIEYDDIRFINYNSVIAEYWYDELRFNITKMMSQSSLAKKSWFPKVGDNKMFDYYYFIETIIHELTHARQDYINGEEGNDIYESSAEFIDISGDLYEIKHNDVLTERYANLRAQIITYEALKYVYPEEKIKIFRNYFLHYLLYGYKIVNDGTNQNTWMGIQINEDSELMSAIDNFNGLLDLFLIERVDIKETDDMTLYDRLYLGLPISIDEYKKLLELFLNIENHDGEVKKLVNTLKI